MSIDNELVLSIRKEGLLNYTRRCLHEIENLYTDKINIFTNTLCFDTIGRMNGFLLLTKYMFYLIKHHPEDEQTQKIINAHKFHDSVFKKIIEIYYETRFELLKYRDDVCNTFIDFYDLFPNKQYKDYYDLFIDRQKEIKEKIKQEQPEKQVYNLRKRKNINYKE